MAKRLLVVGNGEDDRRVLGAIALGSGRYMVVGEAVSADDAVQKARRFRPDVVLVDIVMPGKDGIEAARGVLEACPLARIVMVASAGQEGLVMEALVAGAADFITRPVDARTVLDALDRAAG